VDAELLEQQMLIAEGTRNGKTDHYPGEDSLWNFASKTRLNIELSFECERAADLLRDTGGALDLDHFTPQGGLVRGARAMEQARSLGRIATPCSTSTTFRSSTGSICARRMK
jgi:hypothetical protein